MASGFQILHTSRGVKTYSLQMTAGTSGAVPTSFTRARGIASVVKSSNDYVITLQKGGRLVDWSQPHVIQATPATTGAWEGKVTAQATLTDKTITLSFYDVDGTAVALATGDILRFSFQIKTTAGTA